jgi:hypothetical protein
MNWRAVWGPLGKSRQHGAPCYSDACSAFASPLLVTSVDGYLIEPLRLLTELRTPDLSVRPIGRRCNVKRQGYGRASLHTLKRRFPRAA